MDMRMRCLVATVPVLVALSSCSSSPTLTGESANRAESSATGIISKRRATDFASRFFDWWRFHPGRAVKAAPALPTAKLLPGTFSVGWKMPVREDAYWPASTRIPGRRQLT
jgi:hypothetical protein